MIFSALSQSEEISSDFCCFYGGGIRHNEDIMHSFQNFIVKLIPNHPPPLETRIWKLVVRALDLLSSETSSAELEDIFGEFLDSSTNINMILTTRQLLEDLGDKVKGFQDVRIRPLSLVSSVKFVRQLLPSFSENLVAKVAEISCHVPLAIRLVSSLIENNTEEMVNKVLEELHSPENRLKRFEKHMQKLFDKPFGQLESEDKHALISLTVFTSATISKDAAIAVVSGDENVTLNALESLDTLVKKALIDVDFEGKYYSIHPLIYSFITI